MNMKMEEHQDQVNRNKKAQGSKKKPKENGQPSETESNVSADEPPSDYE